MTKLNFELRIHGIANNTYGNCQPAGTWESDEPSKQNWNVSASYGKTQLNIQDGDLDVALDKLKTVAAKLDEVWSHGK